MNLEQVSFRRQDMAGHAASRQRSHGVGCVNAALGTRRKRVVLQIRQNVLGAHGVADAFLILQRPLVFGAFDNSQVVHAGIGGGVGLSDDLQLLELLVLGAQPFVFGQQYGADVFDSSGKPIANPNFNSSLVNTNLLVNKTIQPPTPPGGKPPASFTAITGYQSGFNQSNVTLAVTVPNVVLNQPVRLFTDYVYNWQAATDDAHGWQAGARLGQTKVRGDWSLYSFYEHLGQEAAISAFTYSDFGLGGTNVEGPVVGLDYQLLNPLTLTARSHFVNFINRPAGMTNPTLTRLQLDALVKF